MPITDKDENNDNSKNRCRIVAKTILYITTTAIIVITFMAIGFIFLSWSLGSYQTTRTLGFLQPKYDDAWLTFFFDHFTAMVGLPLAACMALFVVSFFRSKMGTIQIEALGFRFHGAAGPVVLWIFSFLAITLAIRLVW